MHVDRTNSGTSNARARPRPWCRVAELSSVQTFCLEGRATSWISGSRAFRQKYMTWEHARRPPLRSRSHASTRSPRRAGLQSAKVGGGAVASPHPTPLYVDGILDHLCARLLSDRSIASLLLIAPL